MNEKKKSGDGVVGRRGIISNGEGLTCGQAGALLDQPQLKVARQSKCRIKPIISDAPCHFWSKDNDYR